MRWVPPVLVFVFLVPSPVLGEVKITAELEQQIRERCELWGARMNIHASTEAIAAATWKKFMERCRDIELKKVQTPADEK